LSGGTVRERSPVRERVAEEIMIEKRERIKFTDERELRVLYRNVTVREEEEKKYK
jgi:hypothetical protein